MSRAMRMRRFGPAIALIVASVLLVAACGDDSGDITLAGPGDESTTTSTTEPDSTTNEPTTTVARATTSMSSSDTTVTAPPAGEPVTPDEMAPDPGWGLNAQGYNGRNGLVVGYVCPPDGTLGNVWGTGVYTDDSSVCSAATHAGVITTTSGGTVYIRIAPGQESYVGTVANGVSSLEYGSWGGSFTVIAGI